MYVDGNIKRDPHLSMPTETDTDRSYYYNNIVDIHHTYTWWLTHSRRPARALGLLGALSARHHQVGTKQQAAWAREVLLLVWRVPSQLTYKVVNRCFASQQRGFVTPIDPQSRETDPFYYPFFLDHHFFAFQLISS